MEELTRFRMERGWSQQRLANESGVNKATINQVEKDRRSPNLETLEKLADALGVGVADFFPKAQPPLWSNEPRERRPFNFREARENLEIYCERWERFISEGKLDRTAIWQFVDFGQGWLPMMDIALAAEINELRRTTGLRGRELLARSEIAQANDRYLALFDEILKAVKRMEPEIFDDPRPTDTKVIRLNDARKRLADMPGEMFG